jgi:hypothetical protein
MSKTLIVVILDESGSMNWHRTAIIKSFNKFIDKQKSIEDDTARIVLVKFNRYTKFVYNLIPIAEAKHITSDDYRPDGDTALYDAINESLGAAEVNRESNEFVHFVIFTDGQDNCSKIPKSKINEKIRSLNENKWWKISYFGTHHYEWSQNTGMDLADCIEIDYDEPERTMYTLSDTVTDGRSSRSLNSKNEKAANEEIPKIFTTDMLGD